MKRLSDRDLDTLIEAAGTNALRTALDELRELRALLATPWTGAFDRPRVTDDATEPDVFYDSTHYTPDEAKALGAALIRAALAANSEKP